MNEDTDSFNPTKKPAALKKLADHLSALDSQAGSILPMESDMVSMIVSGTLNGEISSNVIRLSTVTYWRTPICEGHSSTRSKP